MVSMAGLNVGGVLFKCGANSVFVHGDLWGVYIAPHSHKVLKPLIFISPSGPTTSFL